MAGGFTMEFDPGDLLAAKAALSGIKDGFSRAMTRSLNRTATRIVTTADKVIREDLNVTQARVKGDFYKSEATFQRLEMSVTAKGRPINFAAFIGFKALKTGLKVQFRKSKGWWHFRHGFVWRRETKAGETAVTAFERLHYNPPASSWRATPRNMGFLFTIPKKDREMKTLDGPRVEDIYAMPTVFNRVYNDAQEYFRNYLAGQVDYMLTSLGRR